MGEPDAGRGGRSPTPKMALAAGAGALAVVLGLVGGWFVLSSMGDPAGDQPPGQRAAATSTPGANLPPPDIPAGYTQQSGPAGYSLGVPDGWSQSTGDPGETIWEGGSPVRQLYVLAEPSGGEGAYGGLRREHDAAVRADAPGYDYIRANLARTEYVGSDDAADWEYYVTYGGDEYRHVLVRSVVIDSQRYRIMLRGPRGEDAGNRQQFRQVTDTFRPPQE